MTLNYTKTNSKNRDSTRNKLQIPKSNTREVSGKGKTTRRQPIDWPKANSPEWARLDEDVSKRLRIIMGSPESLAETHPKIIYNMCVERFGWQEKKTAVAKGPSRRQKQVSQLRAEIKKLDKAIQSAPEEEKEGIKELQKDKLRNLRLKKRAETLRKNRRKFVASAT